MRKYMPQSTVSRCALCALAAIAVMAVLAGGCAGPRTEKPTPEKGTETEGETAPGPSLEAALVTANQLAAEGRLEEADEILERTVLRHPQDTEVLKLMARVQASMGKKESSSRIWLKIHSLDPSDPDAAYEAGSLLADKGEWERLKSKMLSTVETGVADERHCLLLGRALVETGNKRKAEKYLARARDLEMARTMLGEIYYSRRKYSKAEREFRGALDRNPRNYSAHIHLGYIYYKRGRIKSALKHYRRAAEISGDNAHARFSLAAVHKEMGNYESAIENFRKGLDMEGAPQSERKTACATLCRLLLETGKTGEIYSVARKGLKEFPASGALYFYWGMALLRDGYASRAKSKFKEASKDPLWKKAALERFHSIR